MSEEKRINSTNYAEQIDGAKFKAPKERLSSKRLFRIAAELQELLTERRSRNKRITASANLTHYVE
jgi:homogentisate 1,2-dioxygenase